MLVTTQMTEATRPSMSVSTEVVGTGLISINSIRPIAFLLLNTLTLNRRSEVFACYHFFGCGACRCRNMMKWLFQTPQLTCCGEEAPETPDKRVSAGLCNSSKCYQHGSTDAKATNVTHHNKRHGVLSRQQTPVLQETTKVISNPMLSFIKM